METTIFKQEQWERGGEGRRSKESGSDGLRGCSSNLMKQNLFNPKVRLILIWKLLSIL